MTRFNVNEGVLSHLGIFPFIVILRATHAKMRLDIDLEGSSCGPFRCRSARMRSLLRARTPTHFHVLVDEPHCQDMRFGVMITLHASFRHFTRKSAQITSKSMFFHLTTGGRIRGEGSSLGITHLVHMNQSLYFLCACVVVDYKANVLMCCSGTLSCRGWRTSKCWT